jgi:hypothetical protein
MFKRYEHSQSLLEHIPLRRAAGVPQVLLQAWSVYFKRGTLSKTLHGTLEGEECRGFCTSTCSPREIATRLENPLRLKLTSVGYHNITESVGPPLSTCSTVETAAIA